MGKGKTVIEQPERVDIGKEMRSYIETISDPALQAKIIEAERVGRPQYTALELADQEAALFGTGEQAGLIELQRRAGEEFIDFEEAARERQIRKETALLGELGPQVTEALRAADPVSTRLADLQAQQAETLYAEAEGRLSPERARMAEQAARMSGIARGRVGDASTIAGELLGREEVRSRLRGEARQAGQMGFTQSRQIGGDPTAFLFGRPTQQTQMGSQLYGTAYSLAGQQMGPQLYDPNMAVNLAMQQRSQDVSLLGAQAQADATRQAGMMSALGSVAGSAFGFGGMFGKPF